jgi:hypothetical protein
MDTIWNRISSMKLKQKYTVEFTPEEWASLQSFIYSVQSETLRIEDSPASIRYIVECNLEPDEVELVAKLFLVTEDE